MPPTVPLWNVEVEIFFNELGQYPAMALFRVQLEATEDRVRGSLLDLLKVEPQGRRRGKPGFQVLTVRRLPVHGLRVGRSEPLGAWPAPVPMPFGDADFSLFRGLARKERGFDGHFRLLERHVSVIIVGGLKVFFQKLSHKLFDPDALRRVGKEHVDQIAG